MALKGTLKDFGIADILQLIGQQQKTGLLHLKAGEQVVTIGFKDGSIVKTESSTRKKKELIGNMLVQAEIITEQQLEQALATQKRTLQRLGDALVSADAITPERFRQMVHLQMNETLYRLFSWKTGSYEFEQTPDVDFDASAVTPLRAETVLMEGFRMVDEWPVIRKRITTYQTSFERLKELPALRDGEDESQSSEFQSVGPSERRVYGLVGPGRDVRRLIDLTCMGEFETCKALCNLVGMEYLRPVASRGKDEKIAVDTGVLQRAGGLLGSAVVTVIVLAALAFVASRVGLGAVRFSAGPAGFSNPAARHFVSQSQLARLEAALGVFRAEKGKLPQKLEELVEVGLLAPKDLSYPWSEPYFYRLEGKGAFVLLPPLR